MIYERWKDVVGFYCGSTCSLRHWFDCFLHLLICNYHLQILLLHLLSLIRSSWLCLAHIHVLFIHMLAMGHW